MGSRATEASAKWLTPADAAGLVRSGMWLDYGGSISQPDVFDEALSKRAAELEDVNIRSAISLKPQAFLERDPAGERFRSFSWHFGAYDRRKHDEGLCHYIPLNLGEVPDYYRRFIDPVDILILKARPPDADGVLNFGPTNVWFRAIAERAKTVIVEVNNAIPWVHGVGNGLHLSEVDHLVRGDDAPATAFSNPAPTDIDRAVAALIAPEIEDGACLQIGIGGMPNAVCALLRDSAVGDLGVHTEMLTEGIVDLYKAGKITGSRKALDPGKLTFTFALGSAEFYAALDRNPDMHCTPVDYTNAPHVIMQNDRVVSINSTTQIDLQGQAASESDGHRHISGTGGQLQFVRGAYASKGGKSFICLPSTYEKAGRRRSRIVLSLTQANIVTTPRSDVMYVVTEYGIANLKGRSVAERARLLIGLAHPDFREELDLGAREQNLIPARW